MTPKSGAGIIHCFNQRRLRTEFILIEFSTAIRRNSIRRPAPTDPNPVPCAAAAVPLTSRCGSQRPVLLGVLVAIRATGEKSTGQSSGRDCQSVHRPIVASARGPAPGQSPLAVVRRQKVQPDGGSADSPAQRVPVNRL